MLNYATVLTILCCVKKKKAKAVSFYQYQCCFDAQYIRAQSWRRSWCWPSPCTYSCTICLTILTERKACWCVCSCHEPTSSVIRVCQAHHPNKVWGKDPQFDAHSVKKKDCKQKIVKAKAQCQWHSGHCQVIVVVATGRMFSLSTQALHPSTAERSTGAFLPKSKGV